MCVSLSALATMMQACALSLAASLPRQSPPMNEDNIDVFSIPGTASLADCVDKFILVHLRDGKKLFGILRSYDQFANLVLHNAHERFYLADGKFAEVERGFYLIRGESVVMICEMDPKNLYQSPLKVVPWEAVQQQVKSTEAELKEQELCNSLAASAKGYCKEVSEFTELY